MLDKCYYGVLASSGCVVSSNVYNNFSFYYLFMLGTYHWLLFVFEKF